MRRTQCLLCKAEYEAKDLREHIHGHVNYKPQKCDDCDFECVQRSVLDEHTCKYGHSGSQHLDAYKQSLVDTIYDDFLYAAKHGVDALLKKKNATALSPPSTPMQPTAGTTPTQPQQQTPAPTPPARTPTPQLESSSLGEKEGQTPTARPDAAKRRSDTRPHNAPAEKQQKSSDEGAHDYRKAFDKEIEKVRKEWDKYAECRICRRDVRLSLNDRREHILARHMKKDPAEPGHEERLEQKVLEAFPGLVSKRTQCPVAECSKKDIATDSGRLSHVLTAHSKHLPPLRCPMQGCDYKRHNTQDFARHFKIDHAESDTHGKDAALRDYKSKTEEIVKLLFTVDLLPRASKRKSNAEDGEKEAITEKLRGMTTAAAAGPSSPIVRVELGMTHLPPPQVPHPFPGRGVGAAEQIHQHGGQWNGPQVGGIPPVTPMQGGGMMHGAGWTGGPGGQGRGFHRHC